MRASGSSTPLFGPTMDWDSRVWGRPSTPTSVRLLPPGLAPGLEMASMSGIHDLRHAGNRFTANAGANLRELMDRLGHSTTRAAVIYLHSTDERQRALANAVDKAAHAELRKAGKIARRRQRGPATGASATELARHDGAES